MRHALPFIVVATLLPACATDPAPEPTATAATASGRDAASFLAEGERLWRSSCPVPGEGDLCIERVTLAAAPRCGSPPPTQLVARARDPQAREAARNALGQAARLGREAPLTPAGATAAARALFLLGEDAAEALFADEFPTGLDFSAANAAASQVRFRGFIQDTTGDLSNAKAVYMDAISLSTGATVAAALRVAELYERYARLVAFATLPADVAAYADATTAYCDALTEESAKLLAEADKARAYCHETWQALPDGHRPAEDPCATELEPRAELPAALRRRTP